MYINKQLQKFLKYSKTVLYLVKQKPKLKTLYFFAKSFGKLYSRRLNFLFIPNNLKKQLKRTGILEGFSTTHYPFFILLKTNILTKARSLWKFDKSLTFNKYYVENKYYAEKIKQLIALALEICDKENVSDDQVNFKYLKYENGRFTI